MNTDPVNRCGCSEFDRIEGAAAQNYLQRFLQRIDRRDEKKFSCRVCQTVWRQIMETKRPSLIRVTGKDL